MIFRSFDKKLIKDILLKEDLMQEMGNESPDEDWNIDTNNNICLISSIMTKPAGIVIFQPLQSHIYTGHIGFYKIHRGTQTYRESLDALTWLKNHHDDKAIIVGFVPITKPEMIKFSEKLGFKQVGILENSKEINNQLVNQIILQKSL